MSSATICIMITIFVYLVGMLLIGFHYAKKNESSSDFYLGGRKLGPLVTAMSAEASDMSSYLLMGLPGLAYLSGLADVGWTAIGLAVGTYLNWLFTAKRLRRYTHITGSFTLPQFFSRRYRDEKSILSAIAAIIIIIFFIPYTASGFAACGKLFHALFGANYDHLRDRYRRLHRSRRLPGRFDDGLHPEHHHDGRAAVRAGFCDGLRRWRGRRHGKRQGAARLPQPDLHLCGRLRQQPVL